MTYEWVNYFWLHYLLKTCLVLQQNESINVTGFKTTKICLVWQLISVAAWIFTGIIWLDEVLKWTKLHHQPHTEKHQQTTFKITENKLRHTWESGLIHARGEKVSWASVETHTHTHTHTRVSACPDNKRLPPSGLSFKASPFISNVLLKVTREQPFTFL